MFLMFVFGTDQGQDQIGIYTNVVCPACGALTRFEILKSYKYFQIIFIPTYKWDFKYYAKTACCGYTYELDQTIGEQFDKGQSPEIKPEHLHKIEQYFPFKVCPNCHTKVDEEYTYCPYCRSKL